MAYSFVDHTFSVGASGGSTTSAMDTTGVDFIVCGVVYTTGHVPTLSDNKGNTWTAAGVAQESSQEGVRLYFCQNPTVGTGHTFTVTGAISFSSVFVETFTVGPLASPLDQNTGAQTSLASLSLATGSITPSENDELIVVMYGNEGNAVSQAMDSGMTVTDRQGISAPTWGSSMGYKIQTTAAAINVTGSSNSNGTNAIAIASFKSTAPVSSGTFAATEDPDSLAALGAVLAHGAFAATEDADTMAGIGEVEHEGFFAATESPDVMSAAGVLADNSKTIIPVALFPPKFDSTIRRATDVVKLVDEQRRPTPAYRRWMEAVDIAIRRQASTSPYVILPTSDPHIVGALWNNAGTVTVSAG